jgi:hypothetical protein
MKAKEIVKKLRSLQLGCAGEESWRGVVQLAQKGEYPGV